MHTTASPACAVLSAIVFFAAVNGLALKPAETLSNLLAQRDGIQSPVQGLPACNKEDKGQLDNNDPT
jgi:hypothetical protein